MITQDNLSLWKQRIEEQKSSGLGIREWCESKQLSKDAYYYWRNKIRRLSFTSTEIMTFVEVPVKEREYTLGKEGVLTVQWKDFTLSAIDFSSLLLLKELMKGLMEEC
ncbi:MAG: hypothetical protein IKL51_09400 [Lachnospiraceae bacterium]|nr:hypothetical protein [Lachnospiraceae bacterium]